MSINNSVVPYNVQDYLYISNNYLIRDRYCIYYNPITNCNVSILSNRYIELIPPSYLVTKTKSTRWDLQKTSLILHTTSAIAEVSYKVNWYTGRIFPNSQPLFPYIIRQEFERIEPIDQSLSTPIEKRPTSMPLLKLPPPVLMDDNETKSRSIYKVSKAVTDTSQSTIIARSRS